MGAGTGFMVLFWVLLIVGLLVLAFVAVKVLSGRSADGSTGSAGPGPTPRGGRAREILQDRYARGEISTEEFRERLGTLTEGDR
jgi:putative membrane protein